MGDFQPRFEEALRRRLFPNTSLHLKEIAGAIGRSENTVARWWRGETHIAADDLYNIAQFLIRRGDDSFLRDIFAMMIGKKEADKSPNDALRALIRAVVAEFREAVPAGADIHFWFRDDGEMELAPFGHAEYVRRSVQMPSGDGDLAGYAMRILGWIALTDRPGGIPIIRHDGKRVASLAAERLCEWLEDRADRFGIVRRCVYTNGQWVDAPHAGARPAAIAIQRAAFILAKPRRQWSLNRLSLDSITDPLLRQLLQVYHQSPEALVHSAASFGAFTTSSLFGVNGDDVVSHHVATGFGPGLDARTIVGQNVLSRPDTNYGLMLQSRILLTYREGPTYFELRGTIDDNNVRYLNLALPDVSSDGGVLTSTVLLEVDQIAA